jgi:hypothetical protein
MDIGADGYWLVWADDCGCCGGGVGPPLFLFILN